MNLAPVAMTSVPADAMIVNLVAYDTKGNRLPQITLDEISDVLEQPGHLHLDGSPRAGRGAAREAPGGVRSSPPGHRGRPSRPSASQDRRLRRLPVHRPAHGAGRDRHCEFGETHAFLGKRFLVTIRHGSGLSYAPVRARVEREPELLALGPSYGLYAVFDFIVDNFMPIASAFQRNFTTSRRPSSTTTSAAKRPAALRAEARTGLAAPGHGAAAGHPRTSSCACTRP